VEGTAQLEAQVEAFKGLPSDREAARKKVRSLEREVEKLRQERDGRFEGMVD
jgi:HAUS augmin-like complex subunit 1